MKSSALYCETFRRLSLKKFQPKMENANCNSLSHLFPFRLCGCCLKLNYCYKAIIISTILVVLMLSVFAVYFGLMNPKWKPADRIKANDTLIPPNPELAQPQSPSVLHVFSNAAVCSDSDICSRIGR